MRNLTVFNNISLDGYFCDQHGDMRWAHSPVPDAAFDAFVAGNAGSGGMLVFGRLTYELMASYWPTPAAAHDDPIVAERMNALPKLVFSHSLREAAWNNTTVLSGDVPAVMRRLKDEPGPDMTILGSGTIIAPLAQAKLIDQYQLVVSPLVLGRGRTMFDGLSEIRALKLVRSESFANGKVVLCYKPAG